MLEKSHARMVPYTQYAPVRFQFVRYAVRFQTVVIVALVKRFLRVLLVIWVLLEDRRA